MLPQGSEDGQSAGEQSQDTGDEGDETENNASGDTGEQQGDEICEGGEDGVETKAKALWNPPPKAKTMVLLPKAINKPMPPAMAGRCDGEVCRCHGKESSRNGKAGRNRLLQRCR